MNIFKLTVLPFFVFAVIVRPAVSAASESERLGEIVVVCGQCHGVDGVSKDPGIPNLAGQDRMYLENQLREFRHKPSKELEQFQLHIRGSHVMDSQSKHFDANDLAAILGHYSGLRCLVKDRQPVETSSVRCGECHGNDGFSHKPGIPNLAGQKEAYLLAQLKLFKATILNRNKVNQEQSADTDGHSVRRYHRTMGRWAARLNDTEMALAAKYYSRLPGIWVCK